MADAIKVDEIRTNIAPELIQRGWNLYDYREQEPMEDAITWPCIWCGVATHPEQPRRVLGIFVSNRDVQRYSGKPLDNAPRYQADDTALLPFALEVRPEFCATPKGKGWHIQEGGKIIASGKFPAAAYEFHTDAIPEVVDKLESVALGRTIIDPVAMARKRLQIPATQARRMLISWVQSACVVHKVKSSPNSDNWFLARFTLKPGFTLQHVHNLMKLNPAFDMDFWRPMQASKGLAYLPFGIKR